MFVLKWLVFKMAQLLAREVALLRLGHDWHGFAVFADDGAGVGDFLGHGVGHEALRAGGVMSFKEAA